MNLETRVLRANPVLRVIKATQVNKAFQDLRAPLANGDQKVTLGVEEQMVNQVLKGIREQGVFQGNPERKAM